RNNLQNVSAAFPLGCFTAVTGISGSGKSSLVSQALLDLVGAHLGHAEQRSEPEEQNLEDEPEQASSGHVSAGLGSIKRLVQVFALWQISLQPVQARELVRTFHSRILPLVRSLPGFGQVRAFETLGNEMPAGREAEADSNPFDLRLNDAQRQQLNQCYSSVLGESPRFAELVGLLRSEALQLK
ncbi:hypothetical protein, partial [Mycobacteroides abscessus]|uniref:hypothetical protein n=1 Tax=Mycobacteroides abscessus TaxID=36809 RepID=UPI00192E46D9